MLPATHPRRGQSRLARREWEVDSVFIDVRPIPSGLVGFSRYCWTRSTIGMIVGGWASSMPSSAMTGPR
jgi:hypothetical protein